MIENNDFLCAVHILLCIYIYIGRLTNLFIRSLLNLILYSQNSIKESRKKFVKFYKPCCNFFFSFCKISFVNRIPFFVIFKLHSIQIPYIFNFE